MNEWPLPLHNHYHSDMPLKKLQDISLTMVILHKSHILYFPIQKQSIYFPIQTFQPIQLILNYSTSLTNYNNLKGKKPYSKPVQYRTEHKPNFTDGLEVKIGAKTHMVRTISIISTACGATKVLSMTCG